jgi:hypothetical protein
MRRARRIGALALAMVLASCHDGLLHAPANDRTGFVNVRALMSKSAAGFSAAAYDKADRVFLRFRSGDVLRAEQDLPFSPAATATVVRTDVPLEALQEPISVELELRIGTRALFRGATIANLASGVVTPVEIETEPVIASVTCGTGPLQFTSYGQTVQLTGAALFATGDTVPDVPVTWTMDQSAAANVTDNGQLTSLADGTATVRCGAGDVSASRPVNVLATVATIQLTPPVATLVVGNSLPYVATLLDARGNAITSQRTVTWATSSTTVASVNSSGVVTGLALGNTQVTATSGSVVGTATVQVVLPSTAVTIAATNITGTSVTLRASINPNGAATQAFFEIGTDPNLADPFSTTSRSVGSGTTDVNFSEVLPVTSGTTFYFRVVATSSGGQVRGAILTFTTPKLPVVTTVAPDPFIAPYYVAGTVTPNGTSTTARFEYATNSSLSDPFVTATQSVGSGTIPVAISAILSGLQANTTYFYRVTATNVGGTVSGSILSFRTGGAPIIVATNGASPTGNCATAATVNATVDPNGPTSQVWFLYGGSPSFMTSTTTPISLGFGTGVRVFRSSTISVASGATYFRAVASNMFGTSVGPILGPLFPPTCVK